MSIIHDALKKVQETAQKKTAGSVPRTIPSQPEQEAAIQASAPPAPPSETVSPLMLGIIGALSIAVVVIFIILLKMPGATIPASPKESDASAAQPAPAIEPAQTVTAAAAPEKTEPAPTPAVDTTPKPDPNDPLAALRVEGIIDMNGKKAALINGNIYEEGQTIFGKIIAGITLDSVTVMDEGKKRLFPVSPGRR